MQVPKNGNRLELKAGLPGCTLTVLCWSLFLVLNGCTAKQEASLSVVAEEFTTDELFAAGGDGCGMSLWLPGSNPTSNGIRFFHGIGEDPAFLKLNGDLQQLHRASARGEEFYGQQTVQTFKTEEDKINVQVEVSLGAVGEIETVEISAGTIEIEFEGHSQVLEVIGDAGC